MTTLSDRLMREAMTVAETRAATVADPAALPYTDARVIFEDGREYFSHADQRDQRRAMIGCGIPDMLADMYGFQRAVAWSYLNRTGEITETWPEFDRTVAFVLLADRPAVADPTETATAD